MNKLACVYEVGQYRDWSRYDRSKWRISSHHYSAPSCCIHVKMLLERHPQLLDDCLAYDMPYEITFPDTVQQAQRMQLGHPLMPASRADSLINSLLNSSKRLLVRLIIIIIYYPKIEKDSSSEYGYLENLHKFLR